MSLLLVARLLPWIPYKIELPILCRPAVSFDKLRTNGWDVEGLRACPELDEGANGI